MGHIRNWWWWNCLVQLQVYAHEYPSANLSSPRSRSIDHPKTRIDECESFRIRIQTILTIIDEVNCTLTGRSVFSSGASSHNYSHAPRLKLTSKSTASKAEFMNRLLLSLRSLPNTHPSGWVIAIQPSAPAILRVSFQIMVIVDLVNCCVEIMGMWIGQRQASRRQQRDGVNITRVLYC